MAVPSSLASASAARADLIFDDPGYDGFSTRVGGSAPLSMITVAAATDINQIGVLVGLDVAGDIEFVIHDANSDAFDLTASAQAFADDGLAFKVSSAFPTVTLLPGVSCYVGCVGNTDFV